MKRLLLIPLLLLSFFAFSQTHQTTLTIRVPNTPVNSKDSLGYSFEGKIGNYSYLGNLQLLRSLFKLQLDSVSNSGYVTHGYFNAHSGGSAVTLYTGNGGINTNRLVSIFGSGGELLIGDTSNYTGFDITSNAARKINVDISSQNDSTFIKHADISLSDNIVNITSNIVGGETLQFVMGGGPAHNRMWVYDYQNRGLLAAGDYSAFQVANDSAYTSRKAVNLLIAANPSNFIGLSALSATSPIFYNNSTGVISSQAATGSVNGYLTPTDWNIFNNKQASLVSGTNIKTINSTSLLGSGNIAVAPSTGGTGYIQNGTSLQASSNYNISGTGKFTSTNNATTIGGTTSDIDMSNVSGDTFNIHLDNSTDILSLNSNTQLQFNAGALIFNGGFSSNGDAVINDQNFLNVSNIVIPTFNIATTGATYLINAPAAGYGSQILIFTGSTSQSVQLPSPIAGGSCGSCSLIPNLGPGIGGQTYTINNNSSAILTLVADDNSTVQILAPGASTEVLYNGTAGYSNASWNVIYYTGGSGSGVTSVFGRSGVVTATSGDYNTSLVTENTNLYFTNARAIAAPLTGWTSAAGTVSSSDNVIQGLQKINGNQVNDAANIVTNTTAIALKQNQLIPTAIKTTTYSAAASDFVPCDNTSGSFTVTLPTAPTDKTMIGVKLVTQGGTNTITIAAGGSDVFNKAGGSTTTTISLLSQSFTYQYKASTGIWYVVTDGLSLSSLDSRYAGSISGTGYSKYSGTSVSFNATIPNADLTNSTISGTSLGSNLPALTFGTHLTSGGASYNGAGGVTISTDAASIATASAIAARDANANLYANAFHPGFTTTVSSVTPIVLTVGSAQVQEITGSTTQTITLPVASTLTTGWTIIITSASSGAITIQSSGGNTVATIQNGNTATLWCVLASGTGLASWDRTVGVGSLSGTSGGGVLSTGATMNTLTLTGTTNTAALSAGASSITGGTLNNVKAGAGTTPNAGVAITNSTAATVGTQNQYGLDLTWTYSAWNTSGTPAANQQQFTIEPRGINGATTGGTIFYKFQNNGGGFTDAYSFGSNGNLSLLTGRLFQSLGVGDATLSSGTIAVTVAGVTTSSRAQVTRTAASGSSLTTGITAVCTANTLTITADVAAGTINTADNSTYTYHIIN